MNHSVKWFTSEQFAKVLIFLGASLIFLFLFLFCYKNNIFEFNSTIKADKFGQFGDVVGGVVGSLWALAGVILFYIGLMEQRRELITSRKSLEKQIESLDMQKNELMLQRKEYEKTRNIFKEQSKIIRQKQFESNFYSLLNLYTDIRNKLSDNYEGKALFGRIRSEIISKFNTTIETESLQKQANEAFMECFIVYEECLSQYFKVVYRVFKTIDRGLHEDSDKHKYAKIVRSQFLESELFLLYYNSHSPFSSDFNSIALKYNLFKHLPLLVKLGFTKFKEISHYQHYKRWHFVIWLDSFLTRLNSYDESFFDDDITFNDQCPHVDNLIVSVNQNDNLTIGFHFMEPGSMVGIIDTKELFVEFTKMYLFDRFFFSNYETVEADDKILYYEEEVGGCLRYKFTIVTDKSLRLNSDVL